MTISDPLSPSKFAADCQDILISGAEASQSFALLKDGVPILSETYNPDADNQIRITGLAHILSQALYGELEEGTQGHAAATFEFQVGGTTRYRKSVCAMRLQNPKDPDGRKSVLAAGSDGVCYPGHPLLITVIGSVNVRIARPGTGISMTTIGTNGRITTVDCDPDKLFPVRYKYATFMDIGDEIERKIFHPCDDMVTVRFLNRYDMPECITARYMTEKPSAQDDTSMMYGRKVRFGVKSSTEYTLVSGKLEFADQFDTWQDLLTSRKAQLLWHGEWIDIIVTKSNYTRQRRKFHSSQIEISFQTANPYMTL